MSTDKVSSYSVGDLLEVTIEKIVPGGHGLAFAEDLTIFVDLAVIGDRSLATPPRLQDATEEQARRKFIRVRILTVH